MPHGVSRAKQSLTLPERLHSYFLVSLYPLHLYFSKASHDSKNPSWEDMARLWLCYSLKIPHQSNRNLYNELMLFHVHTMWLWRFCHLQLSLSYIFIVARYISFFLIFHYKRNNICCTQIVPIRQGKAQKPFLTFVQVKKQLYVFTLYIHR